MQHVNLNGTAYRGPRDPLVVVCIDGGDPAYLERAVAEGLMPAVARFQKEGFSAVADGAMPSFTCPNNISIITGAPPAVHGISGNFYLDAAGQAVVMTGPELLRSRTILAQFADCGARVASITAKDKLRRQLGKDLEPARGAVSFSAECAERCTLAGNGIANALELAGMPQPDMYSMELSLFVLEAGIRLLRERRPDLLYLSLTDFVQHGHAPGDPVANAFHARLDDCFQRLDALGAVVALTADHGMNDKSLPDGRPNVIYLQDLLDQAFGPGETTVICPITDAFVRHHGALGGFVRVWCRGRRASPAQVIALAQALPGVEQALDREEVCRRFQLPPDREGDVAVLADPWTVLGARQADHDLAQLAGRRLRSHGARSEARVPFILNRPLDADHRRRAASGLRSFQIFEYALNGAEA